ncbi:DUF938 domain-containing protein [Oceanobacter mangrovi]|uniref:DUF938 domain-containing protein n=1 Tax=Oceanobacter mangrovi TaxID=2862510 RepID=UPI001C8D93FA|nr:DUF938 domain-containing protein [Oceanobacter mangrovi]
MTPADHLPEFQIIDDADLPVADSCLRNQQPIAEVLEAELPAHSVVLEIGSGTGQHAVFITQRLPNITWQPSELAERLSVINARRLRSGQANFLPPLVLDVAQDLWPVKQVDAIFSANVAHYISWPKLRSMFAGMGRVLRTSGLAFLYGPYNYEGKFTSDGNKALDEWLKADVDAEAGIKDFEQVVLAARKEKLRLVKDIAMPANNRILVFKKYA